MERLGQNVAIRQTDLKSGQVPAEADLLLVVDPKGFDEKQRFAVDQFLMRGGSVIVAASPFEVALSGQLGATPRTTGLEDWLKGLGVELKPQLVMDPVNTPFPVPVPRTPSPPLPRRPASPLRPPELRELLPAGARCPGW